MINLITRISVVGIAVITAALVILLSAFNGIESMIEKLYSDFDPDITIRSEVGKTFPEDLISFSELEKIEGIANVSRAIEEVVVIKHEKKWVNAALVGVDSNFLDMSRMKVIDKNGRYEHIVDGQPILEYEGQSFGLIGATLLDKLGGFIPERSGFEQVIVYAPKRDVKVRLGSNPFKTSLLSISGRINFNREVNAENLLVPIATASEMLNYEKDITAIYVDVNAAYTNDEVKTSIQKVLGTNFSVKTNFEKNELIFKTSKSEKMIVLIILLFIFILAAFNLVASLTMLFVEKKENVATMIAYGANNSTVFRIFFFEGMLICAKGIIAGLVIGYGVCFAQLKLALLTMPNSGGEPFPIHVNLLDGLLIFSLVLLLSFLFSFLPVRLLVKRNFGHLKF
ncbi:MAG: FtsX-like permease family protein [Flavobacteriia bacterium]